jgi:hypothetical protein
MPVLASEKSPIFEKSKAKVELLDDNFRIFGPSFLGEAIDW